MRPYKEDATIIRARETSKNGRQQFVLANEDLSREFFRYENGRLIEYDLTRCNGVSIFLTEEEKLGFSEFPPNSVLINA